MLVPQKGGSLTSSLLGDLCAVKYKVVENDDLIDNEIMKITIVEEKISITELEEIAKEFYTPMIKGVVDIETRSIAFGGEYHIDANQKLIERNSKQKDIWGFNVYLNRPRDVWVEYTSLINIRPGQDNFDMEVSSTQIREKMLQIINSKIT